MSRVEFFRHCVGAEERQAVLEAMEGLFLTTGSIVREFEGEFAAYLSQGLPGGEAPLSALGLSSCTAALHLALLCGGVGPGDEVITTPMTFIATPNAAVYCGADPVFVDVEAHTGLIDPAAVEAAITEKTKAVIAVHLYGQMADMRALRRICEAKGVWLVEDAAHAVEAIRDGVRPGQLGDAATFSFYATKNITSAEGGALVSRHAEVIERARVLHLHGMNKGAADRYAKKTYVHWDMVELGFKYNMTNLEAAMLRPQLARIEARLEARETLCRRYESAFEGVDGLDFPRVVEGSRSARHLFTLWVPPEQRDDDLLALGEAGIGVAVNYRAVHLTSWYRERGGHARGDFPVAESIGDRTLSLPLYPDLSHADQDRVIEAVFALAGPARTREGS